MKIIESPLEIQERHTYFKLNNLRDNLTVYLKLEGLNLAGSIKIKTAINMIDDLEERGHIRRGHSRIIESSSGNLGVALSLVCKSRGYDFTCVTDPNASNYCIRYMNLYGARVIKVTERDENGGFLNTRIRLIQEMLKEDLALVWTNQYQNSNNPEAHARNTALEIFRDFPYLSYLFVGAGTTGTLVGCAEFFKSISPRPTLVAVDAIGSVTFDLPPAKRLIPGLGTSRRPEIFNRDNVDVFLNISEVDTIKMAREVLERYQLLVGGSTATILCGVEQYARCHEMGGTIVAISPDLGDKYVDTIYNQEWVAERFPELRDTPVHDDNPIAARTQLGLAG